MTVCKFFQQGKCRFGDKCKFEHPGAGPRQDGPQNPFPPLDRNQGFAGRREPPGYDSRQSDGRRQRYDDTNPPYHLSTRTIQEDLTAELPLWPLSAYGPGREAPRQLIEGESEQSPEEMRVLFYLARLQNNVQPAVQDEQARAANAQTQVEAILRDLDGACQYIMDGQHQHPNRWDVCDEVNNASRGQRRQQQRPPNFRSERSNPFNLPQQGGAVATGNKAAPVNPFGRPPPVNPFGPPPPQTTVGPFAQAPGPQPPAFGQPSVPGPQNPFGQPPAPKPLNPFGQPPPSSSQQPQNPFQQPQHTNGFSKAVTPQNPFGQPPVAPANPFPSRSPFQQPDPSPAAPPSEGQPNLRQTNPNLFGGPAPGSTGFGSQPATDTFASRVQQTAPTPQTNGFRTSMAPRPGQPLRAHGGPRTFKQPPEYYADTEAPLQDYGPEGSEKWRALEETYRKANETGRFDGLVPEVPPLHQWRDYDF